MILEFGGQQCAQEQLLTYQKRTGMKLGSLLNFGEASLKDGITRFVYGLAESPWVLASWREQPSFFCVLQRVKRVLNLTAMPLTPAPPAGRGRPKAG